MKIKSFVCLLMTILAFSVLAQGQLPLSVQRFLDEQGHSRQYKAMMSADGDINQFVSPRIMDGIEVVDAFIAIENESVLSSLQKAGVNINCLFDGFVTAQIPLDRLVEVSQIKGVTDVEISRLMTLCTDSTMVATRVDEVMNGLSYNLPDNYDGSGVIVGIIDVGFDYQHRAFRSNDDPSKTRIKRLYNTQDESGHKALYNKMYRIPGSVFFEDEIYALTSDNKANTHGTHTASIAAGSHVNGYGGMAPGADIVMCAVSAIEGNISAVELANSVRYIDSYADSVGQPCVISLSMSTPNGQHDGLDYLSRVVKQTMGPGRIFVIAAGNNGGSYPYAHRVATPSEPFNLMFTSRNSFGGDSTYFYRGILTDIWLRKASTNFYCKFHVLDLTDGKIVWESEELSSEKKIDISELNGYYVINPEADSVGYIRSTPSFVSDGRKYRLEVSAHNLMSSEYTLVDGVKKSRYALGVSVYPRREVSTEVDAWMCMTSARFGSYNGTVTKMDGTTVDNFYAPPSDSCCIGSYAVGDSTISVGAYSARNSYYSLSQRRVVTDDSFTVGDIASFSAYQIEGAGPTGEALPTVCAPGTCVVAAANRYSYLASSAQTVMKTEGSYWGVMSGTSMAAPTVAGIIALWLQAKPDLSVAEIKDIIAETSIKDEFTNGTYHDYFGPNGKIDAMAGMQLILNRMKPILIGDINEDGWINITDITKLISYLLDKDHYIINVAAADINGDGLINIADVSSLIRKLLGNNNLTGQVN